MPVSPDYREYVVDQLACLGSVTGASMFGGVGLYLDQVFFGLIANDTLYFKVDESNRGEYESAGMSAFKPYPDRPMTMSYFEVPAAVLEDAEVLRAWGGRAVAAAQRAAAARPNRPRARRLTRSRTNPKRRKEGAG